MRARGPIVVAAIAALLAAIPANAATKTLDGKKTKALTWSVATTAQDHDTDAVMEFTGNTPDWTTCKPPECARFPFKYQPAKGVKHGPFSARISWTLPVEDFDLYVVQGNAIVGQCGAGAGTSEVVVVDAPRPGAVYTLVVHEFRSGPDTLTAKVSFPAKDKVASTAPPTAEKFEAVNCGLS